MDSAYIDRLSTEENLPSMSDVRELIASKAKELFKVCDTEEKGFVSKRDMQRLVRELPLTPDQLEEVFDSLDDDKNGFLTLEEFTDGFGCFLGVNSEEEVDDPSRGELFEAEKGDRDEVQLEQDFKQAMSSLGASGVLEDQYQVRKLWMQLRTEKPEMLITFEDMLQTVCGEIRHVSINLGELEQAVKSRSATKEDEMKKLYEEMEQQMIVETDKAVALTKEKERKEREEKEQEMKQKEELLQELLQRQAELERKLMALSHNEKMVKDENDELMKANNTLSGKLQSSEQDLEETKTYLKHLQQKVKNEKRARAHATLQVSQGIAEERESLVKQLSLLKDMNKKLQDDKDAYNQSPLTSPDERYTMAKRGSIMSQYMENDVSETLSTYFKDPQGSSTSMQIT